MKATGIVRRVEACVILGQKSEKPLNTWFKIAFEEMNLSKTVAL